MFHHRGRRQSGLLLLLLVTLVLALTYFDQSLWRDEATSVWFARLPLPTLLGALCDPHPPGYYLLLKAWLVGGQQEFWLRLPSLGAAVLAVAFSYRLAFDVGGRRLAWLTALLVALHPWQGWYGSEVRAYILVQCLGVWLAWLGWRLIRCKHRLRWREMAGYGLLGVITLGVDYAILPVLALLQLLWLAHGRPHPWRWLSLQVGVLVVGVLLWLNPSQRLALEHSYHAVFIAVQAARAGIDLTPAGVTLLLQLSLAGVILTGGLMAWYWPGRLAQRVKWPLLLLLAGSCWLALLWLAGIPRAFTIKRQLVVLLPYLALVLAYGLTRLPRSSGEGVAALGLLVTLLFLPAHQREPWRTVVDTLHRAAPEQAAVVWVDELAVPVFDYYLNRNPGVTTSIRWTPLVGQTLPRLPAVAPEIDETLWIVTVDDPYRNLLALLPLDFWQHYRLLNTYIQPGIALYHYQRQPIPASHQVEIVTPLPETQADPNIAQWGLLLPSPLDTCRAKPYRD